MEFSTRVPHRTGYEVVWETIDGTVRVEDQLAGTVKPDPEPPDGRYGWIVCDTDGVLVQRCGSIGVAIATVVDQFGLTGKGKKRLAEVQRSLEPFRYCRDCDEEATWQVDVYHAAIRACDTHKGPITEERIREGTTKAVTVVPIKR